MFDRLKNIFGGGSSESIDFSGIGCDIHSHLIPGIDDGSQSLEESIELIKQLHQLGFSKIITTPHILHGTYDNGPNTILPGLEKLRIALQEQSIPVEIHAAAEYYYDEYLIDQVVAKTAMTFPGNFLLFELPTMNGPADLKDTIFKMTSNAYRPILAHVERYPYLYDRGLDELAELRNMGVLLQVNIGTFAGVYKEQLKRFAHELVKAEMLDFIGSDLHGERHIGYLKMALKDKKFVHILKNYRFLNTDL